MDQLYHWREFELFLRIESSLPPWFGPSWNGLRPPASVQKALPVADGSVYLLSRAALESSGGVGCWRVGPESGAGRLAYAEVSHSIYLILDINCSTTLSDIINVSSNICSKFHLLDIHVIHVVTSWKTYPGISWNCAFSFQHSCKKAFRRRNWKMLVSCRLLDLFILWEFETYWIGFFSGSDRFLLELPTKMFLKFLAITHEKLQLVIDISKGGRELSSILRKYYKINK